MGVVPRRPLLHRPSTVVGNSGISTRPFSVLSWIRPLWPQTIASTFRLARRGRCEPPEPHWGVILGARSGARFAGRKASGRGSRAAPGDSGLVRSRREADWPVSYQFLRAFRVPGAVAIDPVTWAARRSPLAVGSRRDPRPGTPPGPTTPGAGLARPRRRLLGHIDGRGCRCQPDLRPRPVLPA